LPVRKGVRSKEFMLSKKFSKPRKRVARETDAVS